MKKVLALDVLLSLVFVLAQISMFRHLSIWGLQADIVVLFSLWIAMMRPRTYALLLTAAASLSLDILTDTWGVHLFSKVLLVLLVHGFLQRQAENKLSGSQWFIVLFGILLLYNLVFLGISIFAGIYDARLAFIIYWIGNSFYTAVIGILFFLMLPD